MLRTNAVGVVPLERFGTCTITVRLNPFTFSDSVVEPGDVVEQLVDLAADCAEALAGLRGTATSARSAMVTLATTPLA
jgi:hypothetical protein